jgi:hypothetical protein
MREVVGTIWITKYALTGGIKTIEAEPDGQYVGWKANGYQCSAWGEGKQWTRSHEAAIKRAEEMKRSKISSLKKQIAKLEKLSFS